MFLRDQYSVMATLLYLNPRGIILGVEKMGLSCGKGIKGFTVVGFSHNAEYREKDSLFMRGGWYGT